MWPKNITFDRMRRFWITLLLLSPLAYLGGIYLVNRFDPQSKINLTYDREGAIARASSYAVSRGVHPMGWDSFLKASFDNSLLTYYRLRPGADLDPWRRLASPVVMNVLLRAPDNQQRIEVRLAPNGDVLGFTYSPMSSSVSHEIEEAQARQIAAGSWHEMIGEGEFANLGEPELKVSRVGEVVTRDYKWKLPVAARPELLVEYQATVRGDQLTQASIEGRLDETYERAQIYRGPSTTINRQKIVGPAIGSMIIYWLLVAIIMIFGIYRFIRRARQRELSYQRIGVLTALIAALIFAIIVLTDVATYDNAMIAGNLSSIWIIYFFAGLSYVVMALFVALVYGGGEGDLREMYQDKLTSLDALITGKLFSRNVARALVIGCACGGWGLLFEYLVPWLWRHDARAGMQIEMLDFLVGRWPYFSPLVIWPFEVITTTVIALLIPLPFLRRRFSSRKVIYPLLILIALIACVGRASSFIPWSGVILIGLVRTGLLLIPFFKFDLLTAMIALASSTYVTAASYLIAQPSSTLRTAGLIALGLGAIVIAVEIYFALRGRFYRDEEVRPLYAHHIAERLSMQAEVSAAREAQIRLLPETLPDHVRLELAAECRPAHEVGGDFFDFYQLDENRLAIFMAEGGGRGLGSALMIAFAKGYLLPRIKGSATNDDSPVDIVRSLAFRLRQTLVHETGVGFVYAVVDTSENRLRYARTGAFPRLVIGRAEGTAPVQDPDEESISFTDPTGHHGAIDIAQGLQDLESGDCLILFTDGLASSLSEGRHSAASRIWSELQGYEARDSDGLQAALRETVAAGAKRAAKLGIEDDLTALVIRLVSTNRKAIEVNS